jgi:peroxiredoxin
MMKSSKKGIGYLVAGAVFLVGAGSAHAEGAAVGTAAPEFTLSDAAGTPHALSDYRGKFVVLEWFNNECPFVRKHYDSGNMQMLQAAATAKGVVWLTIASSAPGKQGHLTPQAATQVIQQRQAKQTALLLDADGAVGRRYGAKTTPHVFIINPEGVMIYAGALDDHPSFDPADPPKATNYVRQALDEAMTGKPVSVASTRPYGCSVKYAD